MDSVQLQCQHENSRTHTSHNTHIRQTCLGVVHLLQCKGCVIIIAYNVTYNVVKMIKLLHIYYYIYVIIFMHKKYCEPLSEQTPGGWVYL